MKLFTNKERGWPKQKLFGYKDLKEGLQNDIYKWTYEDKTYSEDIVFNAIVEGKIRLYDCWFSVDKDVFRKIRPGCTDRSPLKERDPRARKLSQC